MAGSPIGRPGVPTPDYKRESYNGFGEGLARAFEFAVTPAIFGAIGYFIDGRIGIRPVLTIVFVVFALVGMFVRMWFGYDQEMKGHEAKGAWNRPKPGAAPVPGAASAPSVTVES